MKDSDKERVKLGASWLNSLASNAVTLGVIGPVAAAVLGFPRPPFDLGNLVVGVLIWLWGGLALHLAARHLLKGLDDDEG